METIRKVCLAYHIGTEGWRTAFSFSVEGKLFPKGRIRRSFSARHTQLSTIAR